MSDARAEFDMLRIAAERARVETWPGALHEMFFTMCSPDRILVLLAERDAFSERLSEAQQLARIIADERDAAVTELARVRNNRKPLHDAMQFSKHLTEAWGENLCELAAKELIELREDNAILRELCKDAEAHVSWMGGHRPDLVARLKAVINA